MVRYFTRITEGHPHHESQTNPLWERDDTPVYRFGEWLKHVLPDDDAIGNLIRDIKRDPDLPGIYTQYQLKRHLIAKGDPRVALVPELWGIYRKWRDRQFR